MIILNLENAFQPKKEGEGRGNVSVNSEVYCLGEKEKGRERKKEREKRKKTFSCKLTQTARRETGIESSLEQISSKKHCVKSSIFFAF